MEKWFGVAAFTAVLVLGFGGGVQAEEIGETTKMFRYEVEVEKSIVTLEEPVKGFVVSPGWRSKYSFIAAKVSRDVGGRTILENVIVCDANIVVVGTLRTEFWFERYMNGKVDVGAFLIKRVILDPRYWKISVKQHATKFSTSDYARVMSDKWAEADNRQAPVGAVSGGSSSTSSGSR